MSTPPPARRKQTPNARARKKTRPKAVDWRPAFLAALGAGGCVTDACAAAGVCRAVPYAARAAEPGFADAWADALEEAADGLALEARRRAVGGLRRPVLYKGEVVRVWLTPGGEVVPPEHARERGAELSVLYEHAYSDALLVTLLKAARPEVYRDNARVQVAGDPHAPLAVDLAAIRAMTDEELAAEIAKLRAEVEKSPSRD